MSLNTAKSCCIRIGQRHDKSCNNIVALNGLQLSWVNELHYLGRFIVSARCFRISLDHAKRSFFPAANGIFGKIGRIASEDVVMLLKLLKSKCIPVFLIHNYLHGCLRCFLSEMDHSGFHYSLPGRYFLWQFVQSRISAGRLALAHT